MFDVFDILLDQLQAASPTQKNALNASEFKDFFDKCNLYVVHVLEKSKQKPMVLKIILRMIGALNIEKQAFDRYYQPSILFSNTIMSYVRQNFNAVYELVSEEEWLLFHRSLAMLVSIELLQYKFNDSNENKVIFLQQIPDETRRQHAADKLLSRLCKLDESIFGDMSWTDLFTMIDPTKINISHLSLTNSIETFIACIAKISTVLPNSSTFEKGVDTYFENRILDNTIEGKKIHWSIRILCRSSI